MICDGPCGRDLPSNFLKPVDIKDKTRTFHVCSDCRHQMNLKAN